MHTKIEKINNYNCENEFKEIKINELPKLEEMSMIRDTTSHIPENLQILNKKYNIFLKYFFL